MKQKASIFEKELSNNSLKLNSSENTKRSLEQKVAKLEADLRKSQAQVFHVYISTCGYKIDTPFCSEYL